MKQRRIGAFLLVSTFVFASCYALVGEVLLVREHRGEVVSLSPGETFSFSFDVFPAASDVHYSFEVDDGPEASVAIQGIGSNDFYLGSGTPLFSSNSLPAGTYDVTISNPSPQSVSKVRYELTSSGFPGGTVGATLYSWAALDVMALAAAFICLSGLALLSDLGVHRAEYCVICGFRSNGQTCPRCRFPLALTNARLGDSR